MRPFAHTPIRPHEDWDMTLNRYERLCLRSTICELCLNPWSINLRSAPWRCRFSCSNARSLLSNRKSASFRAVAQYLSVFELANRPEFRIFDLLIPWIFVISVFGFLAAWLVVAILERTGLSRHIWHLPLFFLALAVLLTSIIGLVCFP